MDESNQSNTDSAGGPGFLLSGGVGPGGRLAVSDAGGWVISGHCTFWKITWKTPLYPLVNIYITMFTGKTLYFEWAIFNIYVELSEGTREISVLLKSSMQHLSQLRIQPWFIVDVASK